MDRVVWLSLPDIQTEANALAKGEVDYVQTVYPDVVQTLQASKDVVIQKLASTTTPTLRLNWLQPPFNNQKVRQALLHAVSQRDYMDAQVGDPRPIACAGPCSAAIRRWPAWRAWCPRTTKPI